MAITPQTGATGTKSTTSGTTVVSAAFSTTAGDMIFVAVGSVGAQTVTGITDSAGNQYDFVAGVTNTGRTELWKTRAVNPLALASGTITVTLSASGARAVMCAQSYRGVSYAGAAGATTSGSSAAPSTGAQTLQETGDYLIAAISVGSATALSAPTGTIEQNNTVTALRTGLMDNTGATTETCSATSGNSTWGAAWVVIRVISVLKDTLTMSDLPLGLGFPIRDVLELVDADGTSVLTGMEDISYGGFAHWQDIFRAAVTNSVTNVTNLPLSLGRGTSGGSTPDGFQQAAVTAVDPGNATVTATTEVWNQATNSPMVLDIAEILTDDEHTNWLDAIRAGYGDAIAETVTFSDVLALGYGDAIKDTITFSDGTPVVTNWWLVTIVCPHLGQNWTETIAETFGGSALALTLSDTESANWLDALRLGYGDIIPDTLTMSDFTGAGYGSGTSDQLVISDSVSSGYGTLLSDTESANWLDAIVDVLGFAEVLSDSETSNWSDALGVGYGNAETDTLVFSDFTAAGYGSGTSDQLVISDSLSSGYGALLSDNEGVNWNDSLIELLSIAELLSDTLSMSDFVAAGYGSTTSDQLIISESVGAGYGGLLSDSESVNWLDAVIDVLGLTEVLSDSETNNWSDFMAAGYGSAASDQLVIVDSLTAGYGDIISEQIVFSDFTAAGYGSTTSDQLIISDSFSSGYGALLSDTLNNWQDSLQEVLSIAVILSDSTLNNWLDALGVGYGDAIPEQITFSDFMAAGYGAGTSDQIILTESVGAGYGALLSDNEGLNWADAFAEFLQGTLISESLLDNLNNWNDFMAAGYGSLTSDQLVITDSLGSGYGAILSDNLNNWLDNLQDQLSIAEMLSDSETNNWSDNLLAGYGDTILDQLTLTDFTTAGYGSVTSDQLVITDSIGAGYAGLLSDTITFSDTMGLGYGDIITETITFSDALRAGYGAGTSDQLVIVDNLGAGYGGLLSDNLNNWQDAFQEVLFFPGLLSLTLTDSETNNWSDILRVGYGNATTDTLSMSDFTGAGYGSGTADNFTIVDSLSAGFGSVLSDILNNWQDSFQESIVFALLLSDSETSNWLDMLYVGYGDKIADQLPFVDSLGASYDFGVTDDLVLTDLAIFEYDLSVTVSDDGETNWTDAIIAGTGFILQVVVSDDGEFNWNDALLSFLPLNTAQASVYAIKNSLKVIIDPFIGVPNPAIYQISTRSRILFSYYPTPAAALLGDDLVDDNGFNWQDFILPQMDRVTLNFSDQMILTDQLDGYFPEGFKFDDFISEEWIDDLSFITNIAPMFLIVTDDGEFNWIDILSAGTENDVSLADDGKLNWNDAVRSGDAIQSLSATDNLSNWQDFVPSFTIVYNAVIADNTLNNWHDQLSGIPSLLVLGDTLNNWQDAVSAKFLGYFLTFSDTLNNWQDLLTALFPVGLLLTDAVTGRLQDGFADAITGTQFQFALGDNIGFELDNDVINLGFGISNNDQLTFSDALGVQYVTAASDQIVLTDSLLSGYGDKIADQLTLSENLTVGYGSTISDALILSDSIGAGYSFLFPDTITFGDAFLTGYGDNISDPLTLSDAIKAGYGDLITEQLTLSEVMGLGYGELFTDSETNNWVDVMGALFPVGLLFSDSSNNWQEGISTGSTLNPLAFLFGDNVNSLAETLSLGYGDKISEQLTFSDVLNIQYLVVIADQITFTDSAQVGYGDAMADQLGQAEAMILGYGDIITDTLTLTESVILGYSDLVADQLTLSDASNVVLQQLFTFADQLVLTDSLAVGYGDTIADQIVLSDSIAAGAILQTLLSDTLNNWQDFVPNFIIVYNAAISESISNWNDGMQLAAGSTNIQLNDTMLLTDAFQDFVSNTIIQMALSDDEESNWNDFVVIPAFNPINAQFGENINNWNDVLGGGVGNGLVDMLSMSDLLRTGIGNSLTDTVTFSDALKAGYGNVVTDSDVSNWADSENVGYGSRLTDNLNNWAEFIPSFIIVYNASIIETTAASDAFQFMLSSSSSFQFGLSDSLNLWHEVIGLASKLNLAIVDQLVLTDGSPVKRNSWQLRVVCPHLGQNWAEKFSTPNFPALLITVSDQLTLSDGSPQERNSWQVKIQCPHLGQNWTDNTLKTLA